MNELPTTRFADNELDDSTKDSVGTPTRSAISGASSDVLAWPETDQYDLENLSKPAPNNPNHVHGAPMKPLKIAIKTKGKILLINPADILAVEAKGNYALLIRRSDSYSLRESISNLAETLKGYGFVRIHRSVLVNSASVEEIRPGTTGEHVLRIAGGKEYIVSRTYKANLKWLAQSWIGIGSFTDE
jgi:DNA-binding LytR/AlgR family response regulator